MRVVVAIIKDDNDRLLITQRSLQSPHGGYWEFPGGKLELNETPWDALVREVKEEIDLDVTEARYLGTIRQRYSEKSLQLIVYFVTRFKGEAVCRESQRGLMWVPFSSLSNYQFPAANKEIIELYRKQIVEEELVVS